MEELKRALAEQLGLRKHIFETEVQPLIDSTRSRAMTGEEQQKSADIDARIRAIDSRILQLRGQIDTEEQRAELGLGGSGWGGGGSADGEFGEQMRDMLRGRRTEPVELTVPMQRGAVTVAGGMRVRALTTAGSGANTIGVSVFNQLVQSMQDGSGLLRAGVTMVATDTGEPLIVPRGAVGAADLVAEGQPISGTDPTLSSTTLRAYKLGQIVKV
ncbi:MAG: phage major capsid protein, partial [Actinobacteria bacterium]|nr:phage major capsid protein [Actinomycetota bacterium]